MGSTSLDYTLPDTLANWPWLRQLSNVYSEVKDESTTWVESYQPLDQNGLFRLARNDFGGHCFFSFPGIALVVISPLPLYLPNGDGI